MARISIKKYSNRRFYDATRSTHVNLGDLYDLVCAGNELEIVDSKSGADITNAVLLQILLERDAEKLAIFPSTVLHEVIRTQHRFLGSVFQRYFEGMAASQKAAQERWAEMFGGTPNASPPAGPLEWQRAFMDAMLGRTPPAPPPPPKSPPEAPPAAPEPESDEPDADVDALRAALRALEEKIERLEPRPRRRSPNDGNFGY